MELFSVPVVIAYLNPSYLENSYLETIEKWPEKVYTVGMESRAGPGAAGIIVLSIESLRLIQIVELEVSL